MTLSKKRNLLAARKRKEATPRRRRHALAWRLLAAAGTLVALTVLTAAYHNRAANGAVWASDLHVWRAPQATDRILVFAPHCDDETLGLSGYLQQAVRAGAEVRVVFMTNGDGFKYSAELQLRRFRVKPAGFVEFGLERQQEAMAALSVSGVSPEKVTFLGYPDRGLASLWLNNWSPKRPYRSRFTGHRRSPYANSLTPNAVYCGESVLADVTRVIRNFRPTQVLSTHPAENHPDHWATYAFVTSALYDLEKDHGLAPPVQGLYLIHRGDWPVPRGYRPKDDLPPPSGLMNLDTTWRQIPVTPYENLVKREAVRQYASQTRVMNRFLTSFVRRNELLGTRGPGTMQRVKDGAIAIDGRTDDWRDIPVSVHDASGDSLPSDFGASGDLVAISAAEDSRSIYVRVQTRKPISHRVAYDLYWHSLPSTSSGTRGVSLRAGMPLPPGVRAARHGNTWEIAVPRPAGRALFLGVHTRYGRLTIDKSSWRILEPVR